MPRKSTLRSAALLAGWMVYGLGLPAAMRWFRRRILHRFHVVIVTYHRIDDCPDALRLCVPPRVFGLHLDYLRKHYRIVPLGAAVDRLRGGRLDADLAVVTFDDGYRDNLLHALPQLQRRGVPAHVFVTTGFVDGDQVPWFLTVQPIVETLRGHAGAGDGGALVDEIVRRARWRDRSAAEATAEIVENLKQLDGQARSTLLEALTRVAGADASLTRIAFLQWDDVAALAASGIGIGSHTISHPILSRIDRDAADAEIAASRRILAERLSLPIDTFAFPNGHPGDYTDADVECVRRAGYTAACTTSTGFNRPGDDLYRLRRLGVGPDPLPLFAARVEGLLLPVQRWRDRRAAARARAVPVAPTFA